MGNISKQDGSKGLTGSSNGLEGRSGRISPLPSNRKFSSLFLLIPALGLMIFGFQNCSSEVQFSSGILNQNSANFNGDLGNLSPAEDNSPTIPSEGSAPGGTPPPIAEIICDPLDPMPNDLCQPMPPSTDPNQSFPGLIGSLYFLSPTAHASLFGEDLKNALLNDYVEFGIKTPFTVVMSQINVTPRPWEDSFISNQGNVVLDDQGNPLLEWFSLRLSGNIQLPQGSYQFAMISDDGMQVEIDGNQILNHDGTHAPKLDCASSTVTFNGNESKPIKVAYYQGPRYEIAMQLLVRPFDANDNKCQEDNSWQAIPASAYSH